MPAESTEKLVYCHRISDRMYRRLYIASYSLVVTQLGRIGNWQCWIRANSIIRRAVGVIHSAGSIPYRAPASPIFLIARLSGHRLAPRRSTRRAMATGRSPNFRVHRPCPSRRQSAWRYRITETVTASIQRRKAEAAQILHLDRDDSDAGSGIDHGLIEPRLAAAQRLVGRHPCPVAPQGGFVAFDTIVAKHHRVAARVRYPDADFDTAGRRQPRPGAAKGFYLEPPGRCRGSESRRASRDRVPATILRADP